MASELLRNTQIVFRRSTNMPLNKLCNHRRFPLTRNQRLRINDLGLRSRRRRCRRRLCGRARYRAARRHSSSSRARARGGNALAGPTDGVCAADRADGLGAALAEDEARAGAHVLGVAHEAEARNGLVTGAQVVAVHGHDGGRLADGPAVDHRLA